MSQNLKDALSELDATNDEHWTQEGAPRLDVLKSKTGENVTRADIHALSKGFNRSNPNFDEVEEDEVEDGVLEPTSWGAKTGEATGEPRIEVEGDTLTEGEAQEATEHNVVTGSLAAEEEAEALLVQARQNVHEARNAFNVAQERVDFFRIKREKKEKAIPQHTMIQAYQLSQANQRANDTAKGNELRKLAMSLSGDDQSVLKNGLNDIL